MSRKTILLFLLTIILQNFSWGQSASNVLLEKLQFQVDSIVNIAISKKAFPGCMIYAAAGDAVLIDKAYGYHTYDSLTPTKITDIFDLASITKVNASTLALMKLYEEGYFNLDDPLGDHLKKLRCHGFKKITFRQALAHQAGLKDWIRHYEYLKKGNGEFKNRFVKTSLDECKRDCYQITDSLFVYRDYEKVIRRRILKTRLQANPGFRYSDLFFYFVPELVKNWTGLSIEAYLQQTYFDPLGAYSICFNPISRFSLEQIVPTEIDTFFRADTIHGLVHDEGAILMNGVSGHAGQFSTAHDLAKVWSMLLNKGSYEGVQYLKPQTIQLFTTVQFPNNDNRRALGFDKPLLEYDSIKSSVARQASLQSYGHTGFTGTLVWADPENQLLFIFLSNRVYPTRESKGIYQLNVRPSIHSLLYMYLQNMEIKE